MKQFYCKTFYSELVEIFVLQYILNMNQKSETGKLGEDLACEYLLNKSFTIIERNYRKSWGELDIIAKDKNKVLVFVEVKTIRSRPIVEDPRCGNAASGQYGNAAILPEENLTVAKLRKFKRTAELYANENPDLINNEKGYRLDLVAITIEGDDHSVKHFENIDF